MNTASLELSKELYELSGWHDSDNNYKGEIISQGTSGAQGDPHIIDTTPAYALGYLLRKLPPNIGEYRLNLVQYFTAKRKTKDGWQIAYVATVGNHYQYRYAVEADIPEDAACKLLIELIKQRILK